MEHLFSPNSGEDQKKGLPQKWNTLYPRIQAQTCAQDAHKSQIIGGDADEDHTQIVGGIYPPSPPGFGTLAHDTTTQNKP